MFIQVPPFDVGVMAKTLRALDHRKATGCDQIPSKVLSQSSMVISQALTNILISLTAVFSTILFLTYVN